MKIINKLGLHARASSKLTQLACSFTSEIFLIKDKNKVNAKSMMEVLMLAASKNTIILVLYMGHTRCCNELMKNESKYD